MKQPISTTTNLAYGISGVSVLIYGALTPLNIILGGSLLLLSVGSALYHGTLTSYGQSLDEVAMYLVFSALVSIGGNAILPSVLWVYVWLVLAWSLAIVHKPTPSSVALPIMYILIVAALVFVSGMKVAAATTVLFLIAAGIRELGERYGGSESQHVGHELAHGAWHIMTATGIYLLFFFLSG